MRYQDVARLLFALAFFIGAAANAAMLLTSPDIYEDFADLAFFRFYRSLWRSLILPRLGIWVTLVIAFEVALGVLLLAADPYAHLGLILAAAFALFLVPFWWGGGALINVVLLALLIWLLRFDYPEGVLSILFGA